jgi:hypothetical protein
MPFHSMARGNQAPIVLNPHSHPAYAPVKLNVKTAVSLGFLLISKCFTPK